MIKLCTLRNKTKQQNTHTTTKETLFCLLDVKWQHRSENILKPYIIFIIFTGEVSESVERCEIPAERNMLF